MRRNLDTLLIASFNIFGGLIFGYNLGIIANALLSITDIFDLKDKPILQGFVSSSLLLGAMIGSVSGGVLCTKLGRKKTMIIMALFSIVGSIFLGIIANYFTILIFRTILGIGVGLSSVICPLYVSEMSPSKIRGFLATLYQLFITLGILIAYIVGYIIHLYVSDDYQWRLMFMLGSIPAIIILFLAICLMKESHHWKGLGINSETEIHDEEQKLIPDSKSAVPNFGGWKGLFSKQKSPQLITGIVLSISLALTGINAVLFFVPTIFTNAGFGSKKDLCTIFVGLWNFLCTIVATPLVDKLGRKTLLLFGLITLSLSEIGLGFAFKFLEGDTLGYLSLVFLLSFVGGFAVGPGAVFWVLLSEVFSSEIREEANGFINVIQWGFNLFLTTFFLYFLELLHPDVTFWLLAGIGVITTIYHFIFLKETKGIEF